MNLLEKIDIKSNPETILNKNITTVGQARKLLEEVGLDLDEVSVQNCPITIKEALDNPAKYILGFSGLELSHSSENNPGYRLWGVFKYALRKIPEQENKGFLERVLTYLRIIKNPPINSYFSRNYRIDHQF